MHTNRPGLVTTLTVLLISLAGSTTALAQKPDWAGGGKPDQAERGSQKAGKPAAANPADASRGRNNGAAGKQSGRDADRPSVQIGVYFGDRHRTLVRDYYAEQFRAGSCPPGLAKKRNGCLPPGQAKKWRLGHPLPPGLSYYDAPAHLVAQFGMPPEMHRYIRIGADILLLAVATGIVVDAIEDMNQF